MNRHCGGKIRLCEARTELAVAAASFVAEVIAGAVNARGFCSLVLAGGNTPREVYSLLAAPPFRETIPWQDVEVFFGDERCVPPDDPQSNYRMAFQTLLSKVPVRAVHRMEGEAVPQTAALRYGEILEGVFGKGVPRFDLILLGMGADGHTASLFPGTDVLKENRNPVAAVWVPKLGSWRITLTLPVINNARTVAVLVSGNDKADALNRVWNASEPDPQLPVTLVCPVAGELFWFVDGDAARYLRSERRKDNS
ncbi:MAG TPA: 6-phosphogluconolactonase [Candidatus Latescibacteria bacterium]|nr:6-phosphogluconolactonase [Candidatus Latescibacterota bacterium]